MQVTRYSADIWDAETQREVTRDWIVAGDRNTSVADARDEAECELAEGESLAYVGRSEDCGGPVFRVVGSDRPCPRGRNSGARHDYDVTGPRDITHPTLTTGHEHRTPRSEAAKTDPRRGRGRPPTGKPRKQSTVIAVSPESAKRLAEWAASHDTTMIAAADTAIQSLLDNHHA